VSLETSHQQAPLADLFASAVHRFGQVWPDLLVASLVTLLIASLPVIALHESGHGGRDIVLLSTLCYSVAYFVFLGFVVLRGLPRGAPVARVAWTYAMAAVIGAIMTVLFITMFFFVVIVVPLFLFAVPAVAAGDASPIRALPRSIAMAVRNFSRAWAVWLITMVFSAPILISMFLAVSAFSGGGTAVILMLACSVPVVWPFSALFVRALYGDLTGRNVLAAEDRGH
jgi:hypothetical protein